MDNKTTEALQKLQNIRARIKPDKENHFVPEAKTIEEIYKGVRILDDGVVGGKMKIFLS
jgi:hypothetical protein